MRKAKAKETIVIFICCLIIPVMCILFIGCTNSLSIAFKRANETHVVSDEDWPDGNVIIYIGTESETEPETEPEHEW